MSRRLSGSKVMITGASGFIGSRTAERLVGLGAHVIATHRGRTDPNLEVEWAKCDITDLDQARLLLSRHRPDTLLHVAGYTSAARKLEAVEPTFVSNLASTVCLLTAATESGVERTVLAGSLEEPEGTDVPSSPYAVSKWAASAYAQTFRALFHLDVVVARIFMVYGPRQRDTNKLIPYVIQSLLKGEPPRIGSGERPVDWVYVDDVVEGLIRIASSDQPDWSRVDLGSGELATVKDVVMEIAALIPGAPEPSFGARDERPSEQVRVADVQETRGRLGWAPSIGLTQGLSATIDWYAAHRDS